jgi:hypothetical protein
MQTRAGRHALGALLPANWAVILALHVPLALAAHAIPYVGLLHKVLVSLYALRLAFQGQDRSVLLCAGAYVIGSEVLWRVLDAPGAWELGKYLLIVMFGWAMLRRRTWASAGPSVLLLFLLLPSMAMWATWPFSISVHDVIASYLAGPFAMVATAMFCSKVELGRQDVGRLLVWLLAPLVSLLVICVIGTVGAEHLTFRTSSIEATSGGFGPNQVASMLGLGALAMLLLLLGETKWRPRLLSLVVTGLAFMAQSALTFSRGGLYNLIGALASGVLPLLASARDAARVLLLLGAVTAVGALWVAPRLDDYTQGAMGKRFSNTGLTQRDLIVLGDLMLFSEYPLLGVGPGVSKEVRPLTHRMPHIEFSRLLSEHGLLGALAIFVMLAMAASAVSRAPTPYSKCLALSWIVWSFLYMANAAMRTAAPAFMFGLAMCQFRVGGDAAPSGEREGETPVLTAGRVPGTRRRIREPVRKP